MQEKLARSASGIYAGFGILPIDIVPPSRANDLIHALDIQTGQAVRSPAASAVLPEDSVKEIFRARELKDAFRQQLIETGRSIRAGRGPQTVLHALLLEDRQSLGRIAAKLHSDPRDLELSLSILVDIGWVQVDDSGPLKRYTLPGIS